jgi:UDP:flavonoid glycosyltransferase YjiC (YdhE family)
MKTLQNPPGGESAVGEPSCQSASATSAWSNAASDGIAPRVLFFGEAHCLAHVGRPATLARWTKEAGGEVLFACGPAYAEAARNQGLTPVNLPTVPPQVHLGRIAAGKFFYTADELEAYVHADLALIERFRPNLAVVDLRFSTHIAARLAGVPLLTLVNAHWSPGGPWRLPAPNTGALRFFPPGLREALFALVRPLARRYFSKPIDDVRQRFGLPPLRDICKHYTAGDYCAYLDLPELFPLACVPHGHFYLGPLMWTPQNLPPPPLDKLSGDRPLAYVSMGSTGNKCVLPTLLKATAAAGFQVVLSGLDDTETAELRNAAPDLRGRFAAGKFFDPAPVLKRAALTICHGGSGTIYQSLAQGVPLVCVPDNPDQELIARHVATAKAGVCVRSEATQRTDWQRVIATGLKCAETAGHFARLMHARNTRTHWLGWLSSFTPHSAGRADGRHVFARSVEEK